MYTSDMYQILEWFGKIGKTGLHARETFQNKTCTAFILHKLEDPRTITMSFF